MPPKPSTHRGRSTFANCIPHLRAAHFAPLLLIQIAIAPSTVAAGDQPVAEAAETVAVLKQRADDFARQRKFADAEPLLMRILKLRLAALGERHADIAAIYDEIGQNLRGQGRFTEALPWHQKALALRTSLFGDKHGWVAYSHDQIANSYYELEKFAEAEPHVRKALEIRRAALGEKHRVVIQGYLRLGIVIDRQYRPTEAEPFFRSALDLSLAAFGERDLLTASVYDGLSSCLFHLGRADESAQLAQKALAIRLALSGENTFDAAMSHRSLGDHLQIRDRYKEAEPHYRKTLEILLSTIGERRSESARSYMDVGINLSQQRRFAEAEPFYAKAIEINEALHGELGEATSYVKGALAYHLELQGRYAEAEPLRRKVIAIRSSLIGENHPDLAENYAHLASVLRRQGRNAEAEPVAAKAVSLLRSARRAQSKGLAPSQARRSVGVAGNSEVIFRNYLSLAFDVAYPNLKFDAAASERVFAPAFLVAQDLIVSPASDALMGAAVRAAAGSGALAAMVRQEQDSAERLGKLDAAMLAALSGSDPTEAKRLREAYASEASVLNLLSQRIDKDFPDYRELISPEPVTADEVKRLLAPDEGLIVLVATNNAIYSLAIGPGGRTWSNVSGNVRAIHDWIARLRCDVDQDNCSDQQLKALEAAPLTAAERNGYRRFDLVAAAGLYSSLISGVESALQGAKRLYVTTSGSLGDLPLGMLVTEYPPEGADLADPETLKSAAWLSDRYAITKLPAVSALRLKRVAARTPSRRRESFLGYGDPALSADESAKPRGGSFYRDRGAGLRLADPALLGTLASLPGTKTELTAMARLFRAPASALRLGREATEHSLKSDPRLEQASVIAFATHGLLPSASAGMDEPGLVFTPPRLASPDDDGILGASEAAALHLNADWVILSACNTASTAFGAGGSDSLSALSRAFLYAGARALLASHWRVSDDATAVLTVETLAARRANPGLSRAQALQAAMRTVRLGKRPDGSAVAGWTPDWAHPAMWAPFSYIANSDE